MRARPHGRPWSGAFNVVMATAIVSIAARDAGLEALSVVLLWLAVLAFAPLALLDVGRARHPLALVHRARDPAQDFAALGFVADTCVLGTRLADSRPAGDTVAALLLASGAAVWAVIAVALVRARPGAAVERARGEWLLAVVATEGLAILSATFAARDGSRVLHDGAVGLWLCGAALYLVIGAALARRLLRRPLRPGELTPDWWIVMGAAAIVALASATLDHLAHVGPAGPVGVLAWILASAWIPALVGGELWQARRTGPPRFTPARWTMVFPLGMYSAASHALGHAQGLRWMIDLGHAWLAVALLAWATVAAGEIHHAFLRPEAG